MPTLKIPPAKRQHILYRRQNSRHFEFGLATAEMTFDPDPAVSKVIHHHAAQFHPVSPRAAHSKPDRKTKPKPLDEKGAVLVPGDTPALPATTSFRPIL